MTIGTSIFLSATLLAVVGLYIATKDRWNWKKLILWPIFGLIALLIVAATGFYVSSAIAKRPRVQNNFWEIPLDSTKEDVRFIKGTPKDDEGDTWIYEIQTRYSDKQKHFYAIRFKDNKIRFVVYGATDDLTFVNIQGIRLGTHYEKIIEKFGRPSYVSASEDGLRRILSFEKYNVFFDLERNRVSGLGMYDASFGPIKFTSGGVE